MRQDLIRIFGAVLLGGCAAGAWSVEPGLPKVEILGREYYFYEVKKGDSLYGVAKQYGWDPQELVRLNPNVARDMTKGARLYYPTGRVTVVNLPDSSDDTLTVDAEPIVHTVKRGETPYGIARQYNISLDTLYANHPSAKYGVKAGEVITISQTVDGEGKDYYYYTIKPGDTLYGVARAHDTTVEQLLAANPGVSESNFRIGDTVRLKLNSRVRRMQTVLVEEQRVGSLESYRVGKNETWDTIAAKTGASAEDLRLANGDVDVPRKNQVINVPVIETVSVEQEAEYEDPREQTPEGVQAMYDSIHGVSGNEAEINSVRVMLLLEDASAKRDSEFTKGFFLALQDYYDMPYTVSVQVMTSADADAAMDSLSVSRPEVIFSTADRNFPDWAADYGRENAVEIVNVFDVKSELYETNSSVVQLLTPTPFFNREIADALKERMEGRTLLVVGSPDAQDTMLQTLVETADVTPVPLTVEELVAYGMDDEGEYLVYACPTAANEVEQMLDALAQLRSSHPLATVSVVGRPSWITLTESLGEKFHSADVYIPSRFYFDAASPEGKDFTDRFTETYGHAPVRSYPLYAAVGYDLANYFIPGVAVTEGDFNKGIPDADMLQTGVRLNRVSNWSGFYNPVCYLVRFTPYGTVDKITVR